MEQLSHLGVFAFYVNAMMSCGLDVGLIYIGIPQHSMLSAVIHLVLFALVAMIAGKMVTSITHHVCHGSMQGGVRERLLPHPPEERKPDLDLPSVIFEALKTRACGQVLSFVVSICYVSIILAMCVKTTIFIAYPAYFLFEEDSGFIVIIILGSAVVISILNKYSEKQLEMVHIVLMFCRFTTVLLSGVVLHRLLPRPIKDLPFAEIGFDFSDLLFYQITIPGIANAFQHSKQTHYCTQKLAIAATVCCHIWLLYCSYHSVRWINESDSDSLLFLILMKAVDLVYVVLLVVNIQIYWNQMLRMLKVWVVRDESVASSCLRTVMATFFHWPIQILVAIPLAYSVSFIKLITLAAPVNELAAFVLTVAITIVYICGKERANCGPMMCFQFCALGLMLIGLLILIWLVQWKILAVVYGIPLGIATVVVLVVLLCGRIR